MFSEPLIVPRIPNLTNGRRNVFDIEGRVARRLLDEAFQQHLRSLFPENNISSNTANSSDSSELSVPDSPHFLLIQRICPDSPPTIPSISSLFYSSVHFPKKLLRPAFLANFMTSSVKFIDESLFLLLFPDFIIIIIILINLPH